MKKMKLLELHSHSNLILISAISPVSKAIFFLEITFQEI